MQTFKILLFLFGLNALFALNLENEFQGKMGVFDKKIDKEDYFIIFTSLQKDNIKARQESEIEAKAMLLKVLKKEDKKLQRIQISGALSEILRRDYHQNTELIFAFYVPKNNITRLYESQDFSNDLDSEELRLKINTLEKRFNELDLSELEKLKMLYFKLKDTANYERINEKILEKKFKF